MRWHLAMGLVTAVIAMEMMGQARPIQIGVEMAALLTAIMVRGQGQKRILQPLAMAVIIPAKSQPHTID
jgi:hypothetical protein